MKFRVGSRDSRLAAAQSEWVLSVLRAAHPEVEWELVTMKTTGDKILDRTLDQIGGKGLFVKELDMALRDGRVDLTVHSCKDLPAEIPEDLPLAAFTRREDPRDVLVLPQGTAEWDRSRPVGTSSLRRRLQCGELFPDVEILPVRGNVLTRLRKLDEGQYGALILAAAGLKRLGLEGRISRWFEPSQLIPAAGQGILAVQCRRDMDASLLECLRDPAAEACARAERAFVRALDGGCSSPTAAFSVVEDGKITIMGLHADAQDHIFRQTISGPLAEGEALADTLAARLKEAVLCVEK